MPWDPVKKQWRSQRDIDLDRGVDSALGPPEQRNLDRLVSDIDPSSLRNLVAELRSGGHALKQRVLSDELQRLLTVNRDFANITGEGTYNPGSFPPDVPNWNATAQSNPENTTAFRGPAGIPSRWRRPPVEGATGAYFESAPKNWQEFLQNFVSNNIPSTDEPANEQVRKVLGMLGPSAMGILGGVGAKGAPIDKLTEAVQSAIKMRRPVADTFKLTPDQANLLWNKYDASIGAEGKVRWEIPGRPNITVPNGPTTMDNIIHWDELYSAYPSLGRIVADTRIRPGMQLRGSISRNGIQMIAPNEDALLQGLLHELQHGVQGLERGWARGGSPNNIDASEMRRAMSSPSIKDAAMLPNEQAYRRLAGEVEARNAETRMTMSPEERARFNPQFTESYPRDLQILRFFREE